MRKTMSISSEELITLQQFLCYNKLSGEFTWKKRAGNKRPGSVAGCVWTDVKYGDAKYVVIRLNNILYRAHRLAWLFSYGELSEDQIDHIDGNGLNNELSNLRCVSHRENSLNQKRRISNTTGFTGVSLIESTGMWRAVICVKGKNVHIGMFNLKEDAVAARKNAEERFGFHKNHGRERAD